MALHRRYFLQSALSAFAAAGLSGPASAQSYPSRPVRLVAGYPPGSAADILARLIGQSLSERLGQPFVVENRVGAGNNIATEAVVHTTADGYTLLLTTSANAINATLYDKLNFNFIRDIAPVAGLARGPLVLVVNPSVPAKSVPEFVALAKAQPGKLTLASSGNGTVAHVAGELFKMRAGVEMVHLPYRGSPPALADLVGGHVQALFDPMVSSVEFIKSGKLRALAVTTQKRWEGLPDVPAVSEFLPGFEASLWLGLGAPRGTPVDVIAKLNKAVNAALVEPKLTARLADLGNTALVTEPDAHATFIAEDTEKWAKVVKLSGAKPD